MLRIACKDNCDWHPPCKHICPWQGHIYIAQSVLLIQKSVLNEKTTPSRSHFTQYTYKLGFLELLWIDEAY